MEKQIILKNTHTRKKMRSLWQGVFENSRTGLLARTSITGMKGTRLSLKNKLRKGKNTRINVREKEERREE